MIVFSRHWNPDNAGLDTGHSSRTNELADEKEGNQGEISLLLPCPLRWAAARRYGSGWNDLIEKIPRGSGSAA